ncbi:PTS IIA-like nitrogen regulatory protein PtsN [Sneathiella sp. HT1-7]|jgi:PTS system nitrogen regulatory IIA component|uniref:PTS IIA-like nitrogen regulatory protein PtsN n=1 Tax=Sneathiella sp. HT1-7 TaxID=2887192 RepID=UPI001D14064A|nr:PTS IIA-like nitrogen regulatory protein PtsN [Sneathiella sp. HT1-7]MCC3303744.1 PTS IIA-like nitrogen regulatory protein PtsN [Sneathiella sp. HT1-7]
MEISDLIQPQTVFADLKATSKKQALQELARRAAVVTGCAERDILDVLIERERLGTTGIGKGIAIPHGKLPGIDKVYGIFAKLSTSVDFDSMDNLPVDLMFLLLAPESSGADHLKALARVSRTLRDKGRCEKLRGSQDADALYAILTEEGAQSAA